MKHLKIAFLGIVSLLLMAFIVFIPMNAKAATIANGQNIRLLNQGKQFYKFTLEDDALVQISWAKNPSDYASLTIYLDKNKTKRLTSVDIYGSGKRFFAMSKGTYYVDMYDNFSKPRTEVKINWTLASKYDKGNFSIGTAQNIKSNELVRIANVHKYDYMRWYKFTLTKSQKVKITVPYGIFYNLYFYDSKMRDLNSLDNFRGWDDSRDNSYTTLDMLPKGTYFIRTNMYDPAEKIGMALSFKWE